MKSNVVHYSLKPFHTEYEYLDNEYLNIDLAFMQGSSQPLDRFLFPKKLIEEGRTKKLINFNLTDVTGDEKLLEFLPAKINNFYPLSEFYKDFTNFQVNEKDFSKTLGFEDTSYRFAESKISDIFKIHIMHNNNAGTQCFFDFPPVFNFEKKRVWVKLLRTFFTHIYCKTKQKFLWQKKNLARGITKASVTLSTIRVNLNF